MSMSVDRTIYHLGGTSVGRFRMDVVGTGGEGSDGNLDIVASGGNLRGLVPRPEIPLQPPRR